ncbi:MAG: PDZ domain-containing protein [Actinomycetes bacterium]
MDRSPDDAARPGSGGPSDPLGFPPPTGPPAGAPVPGARRPTRTAAIVGIVLVSLVSLVAVAGAVIRLPYVIFSPGSATPVQPIVEIEGARTYPSRGDLLFLTVSVSNERPNVWRFLQASMSDDDEVVGERQYLGRSTPAQDRRLNQQLMTESQQEAKAEALRYLGYEVPVTGSGAIVVEVSEGGPSAGRLRRGDVITAIDGRPITLAEEIGDAVRARPAGTTFTFTVQRPPSEAPIAVGVTSRTATSGPLEGRAYIGIAPTTKDLSYDYPVDITIDPGAVSGPSAGLAFTLTIIDEMTPGSLTGRSDVAVTGTIDTDGNVGDVGGVRQKTVAALAAGARLMLVPRGEVREARARAGDRMEVVGVRTLDEAVRVLEAHGGRAVRRPGA